MIDLFAQILDEAFWGLQAQDSFESMESFETIKELLEEFSDLMEADEIPREVRIV